MSYFVNKSNGYPVEYKGFKDKLEEILCQRILDQFIIKVRNYSYEGSNNLYCKTDKILIVKSVSLITFIFGEELNKSYPKVIYLSNCVNSLDEFKMMFQNEHPHLVLWQYSFDIYNFADVQEHHINNAAYVYSKYWNSLYASMRQYYPSLTSYSKYNNESFKKLFEGKKVAFVIMKFSKDDRFIKALSTIKNILQKYSIIGVRADEYQFARTIWENIKAYMDNADFGIAITDSVEEDYINSNVSVEIGYMLALKKKVCLLKEKSLDKLHSDFAGIIYKEFDINNVEGTIPTVLTDWMKFEKIIK